MRLSSQERGSSALLSQLERTPQRFEFFQAIRLLEAKYGNDLNELFSKVIRFYIKTSLAFPETAIEEIDIQEQITVYTQLFGLNTTHGPMAIHYLETLITDESLSETGLLDFINIFNHRLLTLFYQCWRKYRIYLDSQHKKILSAFTPQADESYLYYAGVWAQRTRSAEGLAVIIGDYFRFPTEVVQHVGRWLPISLREQSRLGVGHRGQYNALGSTMLLGQSVWDNLSQFKLILKIDHYEYFREFLPEQKLFKELCQRIRDYVQLQYSFEIELQLVPAQVPTCQLSRDGLYQLGWDSWLRSSGDRISAGKVVLQNL